MSQQEFNATILSRVDVASGLMILRVRPDGWDLPEFKAGQYAVLGMPGSAKRDPFSDDEDSPPDPDKMILRAYSIASSSKESEYIEFYITMIRSGALTPRIFALTEGDRIYLKPKFKGVFTLNQVDEDQNLILVATGTGIAPYMSMIRTVFSPVGTRKFAIIHGARHSWDLGYRAELSTMSYRGQNFTYIPVISRRDEEKTGWTAHTGYVQDLWKHGIVKTRWRSKPKPENTHVFLCGAPGMIDDMIELLEKDGFKEHSKKIPGQIHAERYW